METIKKHTGDFTITGKEILEVLVQKHFPSSEGVTTKNADDN